MRKYEHERYPRGQATFEFECYLMLLRGTR